MPSLDSLYDFKDVSDKEKLDFVILRVQPVSEGDKCKVNMMVSLKNGTSKDSLVKMLEKVIEMVENA